MLSTAESVTRYVFAGARPLIIGHRGAVGIMPENTLAAYTFALAQGVDGIEFDVHLSRDGVPVVIHDAALRRTIGIDGFVHGMAFGELRNLDAAAVYRAAWKCPHRTPNPAGTPRRTRLGACANASVHRAQDRPGWYPLPGPRGDRRAGRTPPRSGAHHSLLVQLRHPCTLAGSCTRYPPPCHCCRGYFTQVATGDCEQVADDLSARHVDWVAVNKSYLTPSLAAALHDRGIRTHAWVINTVDEFTHFAGLGVAAVTTDRPDILCAGR